MKKMDDSWISFLTARVIPNPFIKGIAEGFANQRLLVVPEHRIAEVSALPVLRDLRVTHLGQFADAANHHVTRNHGTTDYVLIYCLAGRGGGEIAGEPFTLNAGELVVLPPKTAHSYYADEEAPWTIFWFHFTGERAADYVAALNISEGEHVLQAPSTSELQRAFEGTYRHALDGFSDAGLLGISTGFARMIGLFRRYARSRNNRARQAEDRILGVIVALQDDLSAKWTVDAMAKLAGMSSAHFSQRFKAQTREAPLAYLIHQRMQRAAALMQLGGTTMSEIASRVGYDDPYYFSRLFKSVFGTSPRHYSVRLRGRS